LADLFQIAPILPLATQAFDSILNQLGKTCRCYYPPTKVPCTNCFLDTSTDTSSGQYNGTGPIPFTRGKCPVCNGSGYLPDPAQNFEDAKFLIDYKPKMDQYLPNEGKIPDGLLSIKGYLTDVKKVIQSQYIIIGYGNTEYNSERYTKWSEPVSTGNVVRYRYFTCILQRFAS
jgi:hypothetical protein